MANIKSAKKRILVNQTKNAKNKAVKSTLRLQSRKLKLLLQAMTRAAANDALIAATKLEISKASQRVFTTRTTLPEKFQD